MALDFVIDESDGFIPAVADDLALRIGGRTYRAHCPPDTRWYLFIPLSEGADWTAEAVVEFLRAALDPPDFEEVMAALRDAADERVSLLRLRYVAQRAWQHYQPVAQEHFEAMGLPFPAHQEPSAPQPSAAPRARAVERTPKEHTGARSVR